MSKQAKIVTMTLEEPIVRGETTIATLQLRKPNTGELRGLYLVDLTQLKTDTLIELLPRISMPSLTREEVMAMDPADLLQCGVEVGTFFLTAAMTAEGRTESLVH